MVSLQDRKLSGYHDSSHHVCSGFDEQWAAWLLRASQAVKLRNVCPVADFSTGGIDVFTEFDNVNYLVARTVVLRHDKNS